MSKKTNLYSYIILMILCMLLLSSCRIRYVPNSLAGKWEHNGHVYEYTNSGKLYYDKIELEYEVMENGKLRITNKKMDYTAMFDYHINDNGTLTVNGVNFFPAD